MVSAAPRTTSELMVLVTQHSEGPYTCSSLLAGCVVASLAQQTMLRAVMGSPPNTIVLRVGIARGHSASASEGVMWAQFARDAVQNAARASRSRRSPSEGTQRQPPAIKVVRWSSIPR